jgi:hypothetical protein
MGSGGIHYGLFLLGPGLGPSAPLGRLAFSTGGGTVVSEFRPPLAAWTHVAATWDGQSARIYANGALLVTQAIALSGSNTAPLKIGTAGACANDRRFAGVIDEVRLWSRARSASEISASRATCIALDQSGMAGYWRFDEPDGQIVPDSSPLGNNGVLGASTGVGSGDPERVQSDAPIVCLDSDAD